MAQLLSTNVYGTLSLTSTLYAPTINAISGNVYANTILAGNDVAVGTQNVAISNGLTVGNPIPGVISVALSNYVCVLTQTANSYGGFFLQNHSSNNVSSADMYLVNDDGNDQHYFIDVGINSSTYNDPAYSIFAPRDGYITVGGDYTGPGSGNTQNLYILTETAGNIYLGGGNTTPGNIVVSILPNTSGSGGNTIFFGAINVRSTAIVANLITTSGVFWSNGSPYTTGSGGSTTPGGANTQIQYNNNGAFGGSANLTFNVATNTLNVIGAINVTTANVTSNTINVGSSASLATNGFSRMTNGLLFQWGRVAATSSNTPINFPSAFTTLYQVTATSQITPAGTSGINVNSVVVITSSNNTGFNVRTNSTTANNVSWMAIGI
jgi:hypothetical protein